MKQVKLSQEQLDGFREMKKHNWTDQEILDILGMTKRSVVFRRAKSFIHSQPEDARIQVHYTCDYHYSSRRTRPPLYAAEIIGAWGARPDHGKFTWILSRKPAGGAE
jgi:hypothetical protein